MSDNIFEEGAEPEAVEEGGAGPPDVAEALKQMQAAQEQMLRRLPAEEDEEPEGLEYGLPDYDDDELAQQIGAGYEADHEDADELDELIQGRVDEALVPHIARLEMDRRVEVLHGLAEKYPQLRDPDSLERIANEAEDIAAAYGRQDMATDPKIIERLAQAAAAEAHAAAETPAQRREGATLETNAGPSPGPEPEVDPQTKAYLDVITAHAGRGKNAFTR